MKKKSMKKIVVIAILLLVSFISLCLIHSFRYPRIARSGYWHHPILLAKATIRCAFPGKGVSSEAITVDASKLKGISCDNARILYLSDKPKDDNSKDVKSMRNRVFSLLAKGWLETEEKLFWLVYPTNAPFDGNDYALIYEYKTGRLVCAEGLFEKF